MWRLDWAYREMKRKPIKCHAGADAEQRVNQMLTQTLKGTLPTTDDMRTLRSGQLSADDAEHMRKYILRSPRLLAQYAAMAKLSLDEARLELQVKPV